MKRKVSMIIVGLLLILSLLLGATYAYWQLTRTQSRSDKLATACLNLDIEEESGTFGLPNSWPLSDEAGLALEGYTFTVKNNCSETVNYIIGLDSLTSDLNKEYMPYEYIKVSLDAQLPIVYNSFSNIERNGTRDSKQISFQTESVAAESSNTHTVKIWIKSNTPVSEQNKVFHGRVFIIGGHGNEFNRDQILAFGNISKTEKDNVTYTYDYNGTLKISGTGKMKSNTEGFPLKIIDNVIPYLGLTAEEQEVYDDNYSNYILKYFLTPIVGGYFNDSLKQAISTNLLVDDYFSGLSSNTYQDYIAYLQSRGTLNDLENQTTIALNTVGFFSIAQKLYEYVPEVKKIIIEEGITNISEYAFSFMGYDLNVTLPSTIMSIEPGAFLAAKLKLDLSKCNYLTKIVAYSFEGSYITSLKIPASVKEIENYAFNDSKLEEIVLPTNAEYTYLGSHIFASCSNLTKVVIPQNVQLMSDITFNHLNKDNLTLYFLGSQRTILGDDFNLANYNVIWNYTG